MTVIIPILALALIFFLVKAMFGISRGKRMHCMTCGTEDAPARITQGNVAIEIVLWISFIIPGLIYSLWRMNSRHNACRACGARHLAPVKSPAAVKHRKALDA